MYINVKEPTQRISPYAVKVWRITNTLGHGITLAVLGGLLAASLYFDWKVWIGWILYALMGITALSAAYSILFEPYFLQKTWRYEIDELHIQLKHGSINQVHSLIPMTKVEYVTTNQGPFLRKYGLYNLQIGTVTSSHQIPAIPKDEAMQLRAQIAELANIKDTDEEKGAAI